MIPFDAVENTAQTYRRIARNERGAGLFSIVLRA
jgi:hypothetical protein